MTETKYCFDCGNNLLRTSKFCNECGIKQINIIQSSNSQEKSQTHNNFGVPITNEEKLICVMEEHTIKISVEKFKEILLCGWHILPANKQVELMNMGIYPKKTVHHS